MIKKKKKLFQLLPMEVFYDEGLSSEVLNYLKTLGHRFTNQIEATSGVTAISYENGHLYAYADARRPSRVDGF